MDVKQIVKEYLVEHGYDGLYGEECACLIEDLAPCDEMCYDCSPGYKQPCDCEEEHDFHVGREKP